MPLNNKTIHLKETTSTLTYIRELLKEQVLEDGFTVYTDFQTSGRGQKGNSWESQEGLNLLFSTVSYPSDLKANKQFIISQLISIAITDILCEEINDENNNISIKWPNDIYWQEKKLAGILIENNITDNKVSQCILGVGINLNQETFKSDAPNPISLKQITGKTYDIEKTLQKIVDKIYFYHKQIESSEGLEEIKSIYKNRLFRRTGKHLFNDNEQTFLAEIVDIEDSGILVLRTQTNEVRKYAFKEIKYIF